MQDRRELNEGWDQCWEKYCTYNNINTFVYFFFYLFPSPPTFKAIWHHLIWLRSISIQKVYPKPILPMFNVNKIMHLPSVMFCPWFDEHINRIKNRISTNIWHPKYKSIFVYQHNWMNTSTLFEPSMKFIIFENNVKKRHETKHSVHLTL